MSQMLEMGMLVCFGAAWPLNIRKSIISRTAKGTSPTFLTVILIGYLFGILSKIASGKITYVIFFYVLNFIMVFINLILYFRNKKLDEIQGN